MRAFGHVAVGAWLWLLFCGAAAAQMEGRAATRVIAVVPFESAAAASGAEVAALIEADLVRSGRFQALPIASHPQRPAQVSGIDFAGWKSMGVTDLVIGSIASAADGSQALRFYLLDVDGARQLLGFEMPPARADQLRYVGHQVADLVYERITGIAGLANTKIAYVEQRGTGDAAGWSLAIMDVDGGNPRVVATSRNILMSPKWSPDRLSLAYIGAERGKWSVFVHSVASGRVRKLVGDQKVAAAPAWSPDGTRLAVALNSADNTDVCLVDIASGEIRRLSDDPHIDTEPSWAPDGQSLVFTSDRSGAPRLYRVPVYGGVAAEVPGQGARASSATFSPDGKKLALVSLDGNAGRVGVLDLASQSLTLLGEGPADLSPSFAPNGEFLVYSSRGADGIDQLAFVSLDGRVRQALRSKGFAVREPAWSPLQRR